MQNETYSTDVRLLTETDAPEPRMLAGYSALILRHNLPLPLPPRLALISYKHKKYSTQNWMVFTPRHKPEETLYGHLEFALKYEGINLLFFKKLFEKMNREEVTALISLEYSGIYSRKIWFLYEWLMQNLLPVPDLKIKTAVPLIDEKIQFASPRGVSSARHRIINNLPGDRNFSPLIFKTEKIEQYINQNLPAELTSYVKEIKKEVLLRASSYLLLKDSRASFAIESESPGENREIQWGEILGRAGRETLDFSLLNKLQDTLLEGNRFIKRGFRTDGGFIGIHDRYTGSPIPEHISARQDDIEELMTGLIDAYRKMRADNFHPVLAAGMIAFGFVFIHPYEDGNGRIHRYLIHHLLAEFGYSPAGMIFPVSEAMINKITDYKKALESFSRPLLKFIEWKKTDDNNVEVLNDTADYYRYFDATDQTEFLFECISYTISKVIPAEVHYLQKYDAFSNWLIAEFGLPQKMTSLLIRFLEQGGGKLSKRARIKVFPQLTENEIQKIEAKYSTVMVGE